jgi:DNA-binding transcriptional LysR family regulator
MDRLAAMRTFVRVVDTGSFSAAAMHLNLSQPSVSKSIARLERRLGVRLLMRSTHGLMPTEAGRNFCERARRAIEEADEADLAARVAGAGYTGRLRVSAGVAFGSLHIVPNLPAFLVAHPNLAIDLVLDDRSIDLIEEGIDIGLRIGPLRDSSQTVSKLATSRRLVLGAPAYFERVGIPMNPAELTKHAAVIYIHDRGAGDTWSFRQAASQISVSMSGRLRVSAGEGMRASVLAGMGVAIAPEWLFAAELASGAVRAVLTEWTLPASDLWLVFPTGRMVGAKARAFASFMKTKLLKQHFAQSSRAEPTLVEPVSATAIPEWNDSDETDPAAENRQFRIA